MTEADDDTKKKLSRRPRDTDIRNVDPDHPYALTSPAQPLFEEERVTLEFHAPPLRLPGEFREEADTERPPPEDAVADVNDTLRPEEPRDGAHDAWTVERVERGGRVSSLPPARQPFSSMPAEAIDAVSLVDRTHASAPEHDLGGEMVERFALGDFTGSLRIADLLLGHDPTSESALHYAELCRMRLLQLYSSRVGGAHRIPAPVAIDSTKRWLGSDRRAAALYKRVDGVTTCETIVNDSGLGELEAWKALVELYEAGAIQFES